MKLTEEQCNMYEDGNLSDHDIRKLLSIPADRYYTIALYPDCNRGIISLISNIKREVPVKKISKSDQV